MPGEAEYETSDPTASRAVAASAAGRVLQSVAVCQAGTEQLRCLNPNIQKGAHEAVRQTEYQTLTRTPGSAAEA